MICPEISKHCFRGRSKYKEIKNIILSFDYESQEIDCINLLILGKTIKEIAICLGISTRTIELHFENIRNKLNCHTKLELLDKIN